MIDPEWFSTTRCITDANLSDDELTRLTQVLGEEDEILPYLLVRTEALRNWPKAREAIRLARRGVVRGSPRGKLASPPQNLAGRAAVTNAVLARLSSASGQPPLGEDKEEEDASPVVPAQLISALRAASANMRRQPQDFIEPA